VKDTVFTGARGATVATLRVTILWQNGDKIELWNMKKVTCIKLFLDLFCMLGTVEQGNMLEGR